VVSDYDRHTLAEGAGRIDVEVGNLINVAADAAAASSNDLGPGGLLAAVSWLPGLLGLWA
jgi:hypothetical protein